MGKKTLLSVISFVYTFLYVLALDVDIIMFDFLVLFSEDNSVSGNVTSFMSGLLIFMLSGVVVFLVVFRFERVKGFFVWIYLPSLLASFLLPLFFDSLNSGGFIRFPWPFTGGILMILNVLLGPAMFFLLSYFIVKIVKKRKQRTLQG